MADITFKRFDKVFDSKYGWGRVVDDCCSMSKFNIMVEFKMGQYFVYDKDGFRAFPEMKEPALSK